MANDGWCPFAEQQRSTHFGRGNNGRAAVVIHIAQGGFQSSIDYLADIGLSSHFIISKKGTIVQLVSVNDTAWANGLNFKGGQWYTPEKPPRLIVPQPTWSGLIPGQNPNFYTISIEHEGFTGDERPQAMQDADVKLLRWIADQFNLVYTPTKTLIGHFEIDPMRKAFCPGRHVDFDALARAANHQNFNIPNDMLYTADSPLLANARGHQEQIVFYIQDRLLTSSGYTNQDVEDIMAFYWEFAPDVEIDPFLAAAQCVFETNALQSYWAARPRRNPAGLGVRQEGGLAFNSWHAAVQAHIGQLLAFALTDAQANDAQRDMMTKNPRHAHILPELRGSAPTIAGLKNWTDDPLYANGLLDRIAAILEG
jgi:N-acetyl-anhydromuramyl-L-alanine amidase AmpD